MTVLRCVVLVAIWAVLSGRGHAHPPDDLDSDGIDDADDNCPSTPNTHQDDGDSDGVGDVCDPCTDADGDGFGVALHAASTCTEDCDDAEPTAFPGGTEIWYDGIDQDCDGGSDYDADLDGFDALVAGGADCDDTEAAVSPAAAEVWYDGVDDDCDGNDGDADVDGHDAVVAGGDDCDDTDGSISPSARELWYDGIDQDCDGGSDYDADSDGFDSRAHAGDDCDDSAAHVYPGAPDDPYDGVVTDCDSALEFDADGDGHRSSDYGGADCDDATSSVYPGATEVWYDGVDQNCDGNDDDQDRDGYVAVEAGGDDCLDTDRAANPDGEEVWYDGVDQDCDGNDADQDLDGFVSMDVGGLDCDDLDASVSPTSTEVWYDGVDQDCDGASDADADRDGFDAYGHGGADCDDSDGTVWPDSPGFADDCEPRTPSAQAGVSPWDVGTKAPAQEGCATAGGAPLAILVVLSVVAAFGRRRPRPLFVALMVTAMSSRPGVAFAHWSVLVYGESDNGASTTLATAGHTVTVWDEATWRSAMQSDFEAFEVIVVPAGGCGSTSSSDLQALYDTRTEWGPAVRGFVLVSGLVPGCHEGTAGADTLVDYAADWAGAGPGTGLVVWSDQGSRGLDFMSEVGAFSSIASTADFFGSMDTSHTLWGGLTQPELEGWGDSATAALSSWPSDFDAVLTDTSGRTLAVVRDSCDWDLDGFARQGGTCGGTDCDDRAFQVYPGAPEDCDGVDDDCNGVVDDSPATGGSTYFPDTDGDGYGAASGSVVACSQPTGFVSDDTDCDDGDAGVSPAELEVCDGTTDEDCDGLVDEDDASDAVAWFADLDGDGFGDPLSSTVACAAPSGFVSDDADCDDTAAGVSPAGTEVCDGSTDEDCDGVVDESDAADAVSWHRDYDGDGFGDPLVSVTACTAPSGHVSDATDCNDASAGTHPGAAEVWYDGIDQDCAGGENENDADADGFDVDFMGGLDCDDTDASISPDAVEVWYDGTDQDCDGASDFDADSDGHDAEASGGLDCNDADASISPDAVEIWYDDVDQDCDGGSDHDADGDGYVAGDDDCDDTSADVHVGAVDLPDDGIDQDCDGADAVSPEPEDTAEPADPDPSAHGYGKSGASASCAVVSRSRSALVWPAALALGLVFTRRRGRGSIRGDSGA